MAVDDSCQRLGCGEDDAHGYFTRGNGTHGDLASCYRTHGYFGGNYGSQRRRGVNGVLGQLRALGDDFHAGGVLRPVVPEDRAVFPQGERIRVGEDGGGGGFAVGNHAQRQPVFQAFFEDVVLLCQPAGDVGIGDGALKQRPVVAKPDVAVDGVRHFLQFAVNHRDGALVAVRFFL